MNTQPTLLVHMAETKWTTATMHVACEQAKTHGAKIALVKMLPANYLNWQGIQAIEYRFTESDCDDIYAYEAIARQYGVSTETHAFQYETLEAGIAEAADALNAQAVFAQVREGALPLLHEASTSRLDQLLEERHHTLYVVEQPAACCANWQPTATTLHHN